MSAPNPEVANPLSEGETRRVLSSFRLGVTLTVMVTLIVAGLGVMVFVLVDRIFERLTPSIRHDLEWKAQHGAMELAGRCDLGVVAHDPELVAREAADLTRDRDVVAIAVLGRDDSVFEHGRVPFAWADLDVSARRVVERAGLLIAKEPIQIEGLEVGTVWLAVSRDRVLAGERLRREILIAAAVGASIALLLAFAFMRLHIAPLIRVTEAAFSKLQRATVAALEAARMKSEFLANMSHEIRTPMNGIIGVTQLALAATEDPKARRYWELVDTSSRGLLTIVNDVLDFSKIEAGKYEVDSQPFDLRGLLADVIGIVALRAQQKQLALRHHVADDVPALIVSDPNRIKQILINLLANAVKFTERGEIRVAATLVANESGNQLRVSVQDTGIGISSDGQRLVFQAFTQVDGSSVRVHGGTGLGLAIAKRLCELLGGTIGFSSELGRGSEFWFTVALGPIAAAAASTAPVLAQALESAPHAARDPVLVVDDNEINRLVAIEQLERLGYRCETATNGAEAVEMFGKQRYAAVLMDCQMPVMDGYTACREIRQREGAQRRTPVIAVTAHALVGEREKVLAAGMDDYLTKPVELDVLRQLLLERIGAPASEVSPELDTGELSPRLIQLFSAAAPVQLAELRRAVAIQDVEVTRALAHKMKGGLYAVGARKLAQTVEALRADAVAGDWPLTEERLLDVEARFANVLAAVLSHAQPETEALDPSGRPTSEVSSP